MIFYVGDVHGNLSAIDTILNKFSNPGDIIIQVGDFGIGFYHDKFFLKTSEKLAQKEVNLLAIRGNHDDPSRFDGSNLGTNIELVKDYSTKIIEGKTHLFIGGAVSVDRFKRIPNHNWWSDEVVSFTTDNEYYLKSLTDIDVVITHTCPRIANPFSKNNSNITYWLENDDELFSDLYKELDVMDNIKSILTSNNKIKKWIFGHYHITHIVNVEGISFRCLDINEICTFYD